MDGRTPASRQRLPKGSEVYWLPWTPFWLSSSDALRGPLAPRKGSSCSSWEAGLRFHGPRRRANYEGGRSPDRPEPSRGRVLLKSAPQQSLWTAWTSLARPPRPQSNSTRSGLSRTSSRAINSSDAGPVDLPLSLRNEREHLACDVAFEASDRFQLGMALRDAFGHVHLGARVRPQPADGDDVQRAVGRAVPASIETMTRRLS